MSAHAWTYHEIRDALAHSPIHPGEAMVFVGTSGSTGVPKAARLSARALTASARSTLEILGGPGQWLLATPTTHIAGIQVLVRSAIVGIEPVTLDPGRFTPAGFAAAAARLTHDRRYAALVPTQVARLLADDRGRTALASLTAVLVGGAAVPARLRDAATEAGTRIIATYGMSETAGGCVYDGRPLPVSRMRIADPDADGVGIIELGGETLAEGYAHNPSLTKAAFRTDPDGSRWFRTDDYGSIEDGKLFVLGRRDDIINTGGMKVAPHVVEDAVARAIPRLAGRAMVIAAPDSTWGESVTLVVAGEDSAPGLAEVRELLRPELEAHALPTRIVQLTEIPYVGPGKPDRRTLRGIVAAAALSRAGASEEPGREDDADREQHGITQLIDPGAGQDRDEVRARRA